MSATTTTAATPTVDAAAPDAAEVGPHATTTRDRTGRAATWSAAATFLALALPLSMFGVIWPAARLELGQSLGALGLATAVYGVARLSTATAGRALTHRVGMGAAFVGILVAFALSCVALAVAPTWPVFLAAVAAMGITSGALDSLVTLWISTSGVVADAGLVHGAFGVGATVSPLLVAGLSDWRTAVLLCVLVTAGAVGLAVRARTAWPALQASAPVRVDHHDRPAPVRAVAVSLGVLAAIVAVEVSFSQWSYVWLTTSRGAGASTAAVAVAAYWGGSTVMRLAMGRRRVAALVEHHGLARFGAVAAFVLVALVVLPRLPGAAAVGAFALAGAALAPVIPTLFATTAARVGADLTDRMAGWQLLAFNVGAFGSMSLIGLLVDGAGPWAAMVGIAAALVLAGVPLLIAAERLARTA